MILTSALLVLSIVTIIHGQGTSINGMEERRYQCPHRFVRIGNSCYFLSANMLSWQESQFTCLDMGSQLAILDKKWEDRNMRMLLRKPMAAKLERWIGGIWNWEQKCWVWGESGRALKYQGFPRRSRYNGSNDWHCIAMDPSVLYRWKSASCLQRKHYICETPLRNVGSKSKDLLMKKFRKGRRKGKGNKKKGRKQSITDNNTV